MFHIIDLPCVPIELTSAGRCRVGGLREIAAPFVVAAPAGARVRTRLRVSPGDAAVLRAAGRHLGSLAGRDLAARCGEGRLDARGRAVSRAGRKRALTALSSSRWAGAITRVSEDSWQLADRNLRAERAGLRARIAKVEARCAVAAGAEAGADRRVVVPVGRRDHPDQRGPVAARRPEPARGA